jgi:integrase
LKITKRIGGHILRHTYASLLKSSGVDEKVAQDLPRHAIARITVEMQARAISQERRTAHTKVV